MSQIYNNSTTPGGNHSDMDLIVHNTMPRSSKTGKGGTGPLSRNDGKTYCLDTGQTNAIQIVAMRGRNPENISDRTKGCSTKQTLEAREDGKTNCITTVQKDNLVLGFDYRTDEGIRFRDNGKSGTLAAIARNDESCGQLASINYRIRRLTPLECCRLQTMRDDYFIKDGVNIVSDSQKYKQIGNSWTIEVIAHIFNYLKQKQ